jgi:hypothetical protein
VYASEVVGMLRAKQSMIAKLEATMLKLLIGKGDRVRKLRVQDQEDLLYRIHEVSSSLVSIQHACF